MVEPEPEPEPQQPQQRRGTWDDSTTNIASFAAACYLHARGHELIEMQIKDGRTLYLYKNRAVNGLTVTASMGEYADFSRYVRAEAHRLGSMV